MLVEGNSDQARVASRFLIDGKALDADVTGRLTGAKLKHTMEGASSVELTIDDHDMALLRSGVLTRPGKPNKRAAKVPGLDQAAWERFGTARLTLDGAFYRLAGVSGNYGVTRTITVTFENEIAALMRQQTKARVFSRGGFTRAQAIGDVAAAAMKGRGRFAYFSPQEGDRPPMAEPDVEQAKKGIHRDKHFTIKGNAADSEQRKNVETALAQADKDNAGERATLALLVAMIQESSARNLTGGDASSVGVLQLLSSWLHGSTSTKGGRRDVALVVHMFLTRGFYGKGGAISLAAKHPDWTVGQIAQAVQGSAFPDAYDPWAVEAQAILDARGGVNQTHVIRESFQFRFGGRKDGKLQNYWDDSGRLADEVRWRRFANANVLWFVTDEWLFSRRPLFILHPDSDGLLGISFQADVGMPVAEVQIDARAEMWSTPPGAVFDLEDMGPLSARWLCWESTEDFFDGSVDITLHRPAPSKKEPVKTHTVTTSEETPESGTIRSEVLRQARKTLTSKTGFRRYRQAGVLTDDPTPPAPARTDCSQWVRAIYLLAGAEDPGTYTLAQIAHGTRTSDPQPGDLMFTRDGGHVEIYVGDGKTIGHGSPEIDEGSVSSFPGHYFMTYASLDA